MQASIITGIIDRYLQKWIDMGLNKMPVGVEPEMADTAGEDEEGYTTWYPINSTITDEEIGELEVALGHALPPSYKVFLKHKHFYEIYIDEAHFDKQEIRGWKTNLTRKTFDSWPQELLINKGYLPFVRWSDWGELCFDTNRASIDNEYPVILWDHDDWLIFKPFSDNFQEALTKLDRLSEENSRF